jgi:hypothetical protein
MRASRLNSLAHRKEKLGRGSELLIRAIRVVWENRQKHGKFARMWKRERANEERWLKRCEDEGTEGAV